MFRLLFKDLSPTPTLALYLAPHRIEYIKGRTGVT
jgi:hypothetical protein